MSAEFVSHQERSILWACRLEVLAAKPGNVHPGAAFEDLTCGDFLRSAELVAPILARTQEVGVGKWIHSAVSATRAEVGTNTNLGMVLLIAPMAAVGAGATLKEGLPSVLEGLSVRDAADVYEAIRRAQPGGMGEVSDQDVNCVPTVTLLEAMRMAAERDTIAAEYANGYRLVLTGMEVVKGRVEKFSKDWEGEVIRLALWVQSEVPDTLIRRKCGEAMAAEASKRAAGVLGVWDDDLRREDALGKFDDWLRVDGHRRNPGTTADVVAGVLFGAFRDRILSLPETWDSIPQLDV